MKDKYTKLQRLKISKNMLIYLIKVSNTCDKNTKLKDIRLFLISIYDLINFEL